MLLMLGHFGRGRSSEALFQLEDLFGIIILLKYVCDKEDGDKEEDRRCLMLS